MKYIKTYETLYKTYKENEPIGKNFDGDAIKDVSNMKKVHVDIYNKYKYKIDDYVKYNGNIKWVNKDDMYQIKTISIKRFEKFKKNNIYCIHNDKFGIWVKQEDIKKATVQDLEDYKINTAGNKYNL